MGWFGKSEAEKQQECREEQRKEAQNKNEAYQNFINCKHAWREDGLPRFDFAIRDKVQDYYCPLCGGKK